MASRRLHGIGFVDVVRILGGILLVNSILSYVITGTANWKMPGKYVDPAFYSFEIQKQFLHKYPKTYTISELSAYNGTAQSLPILLSVNGTVFDVTAGRDFYGPKGRYHIFAGHDYSRLFVNGCFNRKDQRTFDLRGMDDDQKVNRIMKSWLNFFRKNPYYWEVGNMVFPDLTDTSPPSKCNDGLKYPGRT